MRSYFAHLETLASSPNAITSRPVYRASAIFPAIQQKGISTRLLFLGYWMLKRNVDKVASIVTLRSTEGAVLARSTFTITEAKAYRVELSDLLEQTTTPKTETFEGSIEIEFFAVSNLVFPYPAVVVNYYGQAFSTVVHTAQRTYNDFEDLQKNSQTAVPESGFNIYANAKEEPIIGLINGSLAQEKGQIEFQFFNHKGETLEFTKDLGMLPPYQTTLVYPAREIDLEAFLDNRVGTCKTKFNVNWIFPRLLVGNYHFSPLGLSITHSYYDCSEATSNSNYWHTPEPNWEPASLMVPVWISEGYFTTIYFYPIYSPSLLAIDIEFYSESGQMLGKIDQILTLESPCLNYDAIHTRALVDKLHLNPQEVVGARLIARPLEGSLLPARIKMALDVGNIQQGLPCNICMNLQMFNPPLATKPSSFKWLPILADQPLSNIWLMSSSPQKNYSTHATVDLTFYRESDTQTLKRSVTLPPHGSLILSLPEDEELVNFFAHTVGWATLTTNNAYLTTYYFCANPSGAIGGDHGF